MWNKSNYFIGGKKKTTWKLSLALLTFFQDLLLVFQLDKYQDTKSVYESKIVWLWTLYEITSKVLAESILLPS